MTAPPLQPLELVPLPEIEEGPVWWVWDAEFTLQRIGTQRAKVILPFEPAPPQYLTKPQQNFAEYSLPMLFWVQGEGQFFDQPPSFLREMTRLARRAGVAIVILEEDDQEYVSKRATRLVEAIRRTSEYDSQSTLTILRSGVTAKLRRIGDACVGGWSRGGRAAILACGGAASETIPKSIRPRRFISLAPEGGPMVSDPAASLNNLNLAGVTGLVVFSIADADVFSLATGTLMPQGGNLAFLRYWCVDHNAFMNAQSESGFKPPPWGTLSPPCHIPAPTEGGAGTLRRQLFARWGALAAVFAAEGEPAAVARASIFRNGLRGLGSQPHDLYFRREKGVQYGDVEKVATTTPQGKPTSVSWSRLKLESVKALSVASIGNAASPRLNTSDSPASATAQPFMLLDDGGRCVILIARAGKPYALNWTMTPSSLANRVAVSIAAYTQLSFANAGLPLENLGELIASGRLLMVPGSGAGNPEFSLGLLRISVRSAGRQPGSPLGPVSTHVVSSNPIFASSTAKTNNAPMAAYYNTFVNSFDLGSPVSKSVNVHAEVTMRNTCILVFADPRLL